MAELTKEEARHVPHTYVDAAGWCAVCGRSEAWKAHAAPAEPAQEAPPVEAPSEDEKATGPLEG